MFLLRLKVSSANLHRLALVSLLLVRVQSPRQVPVHSRSQFLNNKMSSRLEGEKACRFASGADWFDCNSSTFFLPGLPVFLLCFSFILLQGSLLHHSSQVPDDAVRADKQSKFTSTAPPHLYLCYYALYVDLYVMLQFSQCE